jgi:hypothetical protein
LSPLLHLFGEALVEVVATFVDVRDVRLAIVPKGIYIEIVWDCSIGCCQESDSAAVVERREEMREIGQV